MTDTSSYDPVIVGVDGPDPSRSIRDIAVGRTPTAELNGDFAGAWSVELRGEPLTQCGRELALLLGRVRLVCPGEAFAFDTPATELAPLSLDVVFECRAP